MQTQLRIVVFIFTTSATIFGGFGGLWLIQRTLGLPNRLIAMAPIGAAFGIRFTAAFACVYSILTQGKSSRGNT
jgi:hypothetical protein